MTCPYKENFNCPFIDTADMDKPSCLECEYYYNDGSEFINCIEDWNELI